MLCNLKLLEQPLV